MITIRHCHTCALTTWHHYSLAIINNVLLVYSFVGILVGISHYVFTYHDQVEGEQLEEAVLQEHLADLTMASEALAEDSSIYQLVDSFNQVCTVVTFNDQSCNVFFA